MPRRKHASRRKSVVIGLVLITGGCTYITLQTTEPFTKQAESGTHGKQTDTDPRDKASFGYGTHVKTPTGPYSEEELEEALAEGPVNIQTTIDETERFVERLQRDLAHQETFEKITPSRFQALMTPAVRLQVDLHVERLNEAARMADQLTEAAQQKRVASDPVRQTKMIRLTGHLNRFARALEQYTVTTTFRSWAEAAEYLSENEESFLFKIPFEATYDTTQKATDSNAPDVPPDAFPYETAMNAFMELSQAKKMMRDEAQRLRLSTLSQERASSLDLSTLETGLTHLEHGLLLLKNADYPEYVAPDHDRMEQASVALQSGIDSLRQLPGSLEETETKKSAVSQLLAIEETLDFTLPSKRHLISR